VGPSSCLSSSWTTLRTRRGSRGWRTLGLYMDRSTPRGNTRGAYRLPQCTGAVDARGFSHETWISRRRGATLRRLHGTAVRRQNRRFCMHYVSPLVTRPEVGIVLSKHKALSPPLTNCDHKGQPASGQTTKDLGRNLVSRRYLLDFVRPAISRSALPLRPRLRRRQDAVPAAPVLGTFTASATLGSPRGIPVPRFTSFRVIIWTVN